MKIQGKPHKTQKILRLGRDAHRQRKGLYIKANKKHLDHVSDADQLLTELDPAQGATTA